MSTANIACDDKEPFALMVLGDTMLPEFNNGMVITIDPAHPLISGVFVVAVMEGKVYFGQYQLNNNITYLSFLQNSQTVVLTGNYHIKGVVIQSYQKHISTHYTYPEANKFISFKRNRLKKLNNKTCQPLDKNLNNI